MLNEQLQSMVDYLQRERGVDREIVLQAIESAMENAARKDSESEEEEFRIEIDRKTLDMKAFAQKQVVSPPAVTDRQIALDDARKINPAARIGETVEVTVPTRKLGRIAAQTARQTIMQKLRQAEKDRIYELFKDRVGDIVTGVVRRFEKSDVFIEIENAEAVMPGRQRIPIEEYEVGERIRAHIAQVTNEASGPRIELSRNHPDFVRRLFELEVSEIADGTVEIMGIAREAGYRSKVAVLCHDEHIDPVGACVGIRGMRVKNIVRELSGEKIDIVRWSDDIKKLVANSLAPAKLSSIEIDEETRTVRVLVDPDQLSLAIGKRGQNARLTAKLTGWRVDIERKESEEEKDFERKIQEAVESLAAIEGIGFERAEKLVSAGFLSQEGILMAEIGDIAEEVEGITAGEAEEVWHAVAAAHEKEHGELE
ncbi:transcription termination factor NusA [Kiritimatiella glycovorans]|uniref:Transcription termination/antitermination protein NusA n=1 Tax=Kiritimatiella glycovorans TaxID=1307763 RepID=A0A0G3EGU7_9BACT|nr:transcription termination factor NusA [Kiritimatiella glycovorans]AKJ63349.1 putative transcription termination/antitermination protein NusA [Kiritimatiella glycovorans]